jgi:Domain of unknown function (DUF6438)
VASSQGAAHCQPAAEPAAAADSRCALAAEPPAVRRLKARLMRLALSLIVLSALTGAGARSARPVPEVTEITLQRTSCYGTCPVYNVELRSDGRAAYHGGSNSRLEGEWVGKVSAKDFAELVRFADAIGYFSYGDLYERPVTDNPWAITTIVRKGIRKTVRNYAESGPLALSGLEAAIDVATTRIEWSKAK